MCDDDAWDLICKLFKVVPMERLGAGCFEWVPPPKIVDEDEAKATTDDGDENNSSPPPPPPLGRVIEHGQ